MVGKRVEGWPIENLVVLTKAVNLTITTKECWPEKCKGPDRVWVNPPGSELILGCLGCHLYYSVLISIVCYYSLIGQTGSKPSNSP